MRYFELKPSISMVRALRMFKELEQLKGIKDADMYGDILRLYGENYSMKQVVKILKDYGISSYREIPQTSSPT